MRSATVTDNRSAKRAADAAAEAHALLARSGKDPILAAILRQMHGRKRLWRLCRRAACKRGRRCCRDETACGARRWPVVRAALREMMRRKLNHRPLKGIDSRQIRRWKERNGQLHRPTITVRWLRPGDKPGRRWRE